MSDYVARIKKLDVAKTKGLLDKHTNIATHVNRLTRELEARDFSTIEADILSL